MMRIALILCLFLIQGCVAAPPWQTWMFEGPPAGKEYHPLYVQGWKDGCETGTSANTNHWYKFHYKFKQDSTLAQDQVYYKGWKDAFNYCGRYIYQWKKGSNLI